jgi:two-component system, cell cycle sensor histidine kinase and response regulator CckA
MTPTRILVVEDETIVALDLKCRLTEMGYEVVGMAERGEEALELADRVHPDLVLMDICLKGEMDGISAAETIRQRWLLPVIYLTAFSEGHTLQRAKLTEPFGYVIKPFEDREIQSAIEMGLYKHQAERRLRESERRFATTLTSIGDGVIATDPRGLVTFLNPTAEALTGWSLSEASGQPLAEVFRIADEQTGQPQEDPVARVLREGRTVGLSNHTNLLSRDGRVIPIDDCAAPILDDLSRISGTVLVFRDVTERRRVAGERERLQAELMHAQKMESVARLAGGVAHDFNNMLLAILGHAELAMSQCRPTEPVQDDLKAIWTAAQRSSDLTRQLLAFARKQIVVPRVVDLNEIVAGMLKMLLRLIGEDIELTWKPGARLWPVLIDPSQIDQILVNLCVNARDAIAGVGKVTIETENVVFDEEYCALNPDFVCGEFVLIAVSDNGCGMDKDVMSQLFEPFFTTKDVGKGTGLGLATVYGIVKQNDGFIKVYSEPGQGTAFKVYLRRSVTPFEKPPLERPTALSRGHGEVVLLVEDEQVILNMGRIMLEQLGYRVLTAATPSEAIGQARSQPEIELLITDVVMPEMNGRELARLLVEIKPALKCLFTSGYTANVIAHHGVLDEGTHFLHKPFSLRDLATKIRQVLEWKTS